jgi:biotin-dependent carboxylase-like uncharacterized protein
LRVDSGIAVVAPGFQTTVQDLGRPGHARSGISASGAADPVALRVGNRLVGNAEGGAALEMTLVGGSFRFDSDAIVALTGASASATVGGRPLESWTAASVRAGETLACGPLRGGARAYLCVRGGIDVPLLFGSASTHLMTGLGGHHGRALAAGDRLPLGRSVAGDPASRSVDARDVPGYAGGPFRATEGPQASWFAPAARERFWGSTWAVSESCDRMGLRLIGPALAGVAGRELVTEGVCWGAVQVPAGGAPIVLSVEHQTTGGYPKIANVAAVDLARLGGLRPRDTLRFTPMTIADAHALYRAQEAALDALFA